MNTKKEIVYPIFLDCIQYTDDIFWENIFEDLSYSKTPYGTYISKDCFCCNYKTKEFNYKIEKKDPRILYNDITNLLIKKLGLLSQKDKIKKKVDFHIIEEEIKEGRKLWSNIRRKNIKDLMIENFVIAMKNKYNLNIKQAKYLISVIFIGMVFKIITIKDIDYRNGIVYSINGIEFASKQVILNKNIYDIKIPQTCILIEDKNLLSDNWSKYIENLRKIN